VAKIKVLIADADETSQATLLRLLEEDAGLQIVGRANNAESVLEMCKRLQPDVLLLDNSLPDRSGIQVTEILRREQPLTIVVLLASSAERATFRDAILAGVNDFLEKPVEKDAITAAVHNAYHREWQRRVRQGVQRPDSKVAKGQVALIFGTKGGVGRTTVAVNLATALQTEMEQNVALFDLDLQFGDVAIMLDLPPKQTITHLVRGLRSTSDNFEREQIDKVLMHHSTGLRVLPGPNHPEEAELVSADHVKKLLKLLKKEFDYIIIDCPALFQETALAALDMADHIILLAATDVPTLKNAKLSLDVILTLGCPKEKVHLVINRASSSVGFETEAAEKHLGIPIFARIQSDGRTAVAAVNKGIPFVLSDPKAVISRSIHELGRAIIQLDMGHHTTAEITENAPVKKRWLPSLLKKSLR